MDQKAKVNRSGATNLFIDSIQTFIGSFYIANSLLEATARGLIKDMSAIVEHCLFVKFYTSSHLHYAI